MDRATQNQMTSAIVLDIVTTLNGQGLDRETFGKEFEAMFMLRTGQKLSFEFLMQMIGV